jgi:hypothetical protein
MTYCIHGGRSHEFPIEGETGAYCKEHGVTLLYYGEPITCEDLTPSTATPDADQE